MSDKLKAIALTPCTSTLIHSYGFCPETRTLRVQFNDKGKPGPIWDYAGVTPEKHAEMQDAASIGRYFGKEIRPAFAGTPFNPDEKEEA